jgi:hypothetical protein
VLAEYGFRVGLGREAAKAVVRVCACLRASDCPWLSVLGDRKQPAKSVIGITGDVAYRIDALHLVAIRCAARGVRVVRVDVGNIIAYDALHRVKATTYPSGRQHAHRIE